jgi:hypothetical protein
MVAAELLAWVDDHGITLKQLRQDDLDRWLDEEKSQRRNRIRYFLKWTADRGLTRKLEVALIPRQQPADLLSDDERWRLLQRCLHDEALPVDIRAAGALVLLFGLQAQRIRFLCAEHVVTPAGVAIARAREAAAAVPVCHTLTVPILHIEHQIADLGTWLRDFASRAPAWQQAGITKVHVLQAQDDPQHIVELIFFDTGDAANNYRTFLREQVWSSSSSPGLAGNPSAIIFEELGTDEDAAAAVLRSMAAAERSAREIEVKKAMIAQLERAPWRIEYRYGSTYDLWNDSATPKFYVGITGEGVLYPRSAPRIDGHNLMSFQGRDAMNGGTRVDVTWHQREDQSDRPRRWSGNKPPRPPQAG